MRVGSTSYFSVVCVSYSCLRLLVIVFSIPLYRRFEPDAFVSLGEIAHNTYLADHLRRRVGRWTNVGVVNGVGNEIESNRIESHR